MKCPSCGAEWKNPITLCPDCGYTEIKKLVAEEYLKAAWIYLFIGFIVYFIATICTFRFSPIMNESWTNSIIAGLILSPVFMIATPFIDFILLTSKNTWLIAVDVALNLGLIFFIIMSIKNDKKLYKVLSHIFIFVKVFSAIGCMVYSIIWLLPVSMGV